MSDDERATGFLDEPAELTESARALYAEDVDDVGYVMNLSRAWAHDADTLETLLGLSRTVAAGAGLTPRERGVLVLATTSTMGDAYCSLVWGGRLAGWASPDVSAALLTGRDDLLDPRERALATWARAVVSDPNGIQAADLDELRFAGYDDAQILAITCFVALRLAFATVNDSLGARPDAALRTTTPAVVVDAVTYGRPIAD
ncbi:carboxymuconolactone decarboxylase family protein [Xylanimonas protaetiae]|uniref:Carboxymuconolactone decarboxylase family protein n=1 Tax=Xylanimonas protaetiae TaxID=2509457 RepID=A0A4P6F8S5_9MICO|nr:hypothetical protein [Xylanimonas protaetiae]QAY71293.1 hypothetical protein ET471_15700 [Xylanimonas protaetiae]